MHHIVPEKELGNEIANLFSLFCVNFILPGVSAQDAETEALAE
jgi:hypothetical protein